MHKKQWLIFVVGCVLSAGLFCILGRFDISLGTDTIHRTVNPDKSITVVETVTSPHFYAKKMGRALFGFFAVLGVTVFVVRKVGRTLSTHNSQSRIYSQDDAGVWPPPPAGHI